MLSLNVADALGLESLMLLQGPGSNLNTVSPGTISVYNNGKGLPVVVHKEHHVYVPEMVFGQLLSSDNYNDNDAKVVGAETTSPGCLGTLEDHLSLGKLYTHFWSI
eukprot:1022686-Amphidinium_carterae.3